MNFGKQSTAYTAYNEVFSFCLVRIRPKIEGDEKYMK